MSLNRMKRMADQEGVSLQGILTLLLFLAFIFLFREVFVGLFKQWINDENYNHGLLVPLISAFLVYRGLDRVPRRSEPSVMAALPFVVPGMMLYLAGTVAAELLSLRLAMLFVFWGIVRGLWGKLTFRHFRFPLFFLIFMIPLPYVVFYRLAFPLQLLSATASAKVLGFLGVTHVQTGNIIHLRETSLDVVTACSGLRSLIALITFGVLAAGIFPMRRTLRVVLVAMAVPIAMATNALRIVLTAVLVHTSGHAFLEGTLHDAMGLLTFSLGIVLLFVLGGGFKWRQPSE